MIGDKDRYALVTGASSGIGYELAKLFAQDGKNIVVVARSKDKLENLKTEVENKHGITVRVLPKDLSDPKSPQEIFSELEQENINVDVLVNNAGFGLAGMFSENDLQKVLEMIQVNMTSLVHLTKLFLKRMLENKSGKILNVSSMMGFAPTPLQSIYPATKSFIIFFSEMLANELQGTGITVTCLCPGVTDTLFFERAGMVKSKVGKAKRDDAAGVAIFGYSALKKGKVLAIPLGWRYVPFAVRILPRNIFMKIGRHRSIEPA